MGQPMVDSTPYITKKERHQPLLLFYIKRSGNCANDTRDCYIDLRNLGHILALNRAIQPKLVALVAGAGRPGHHYAISAKTIYTSVNLYPTGYHSATVIQKVPLSLFTMPALVIIAFLGDQVPNAANLLPASSLRRANSFNAGRSILLSSVPFGSRGQGSLL